MIKVKDKYNSIYILGICGILLLLSTFTIQAQTVSIPDDNLRAAMEKALDKTPGDTITPEEMETLTRFEANNANITDLTGLESATNLVRVVLVNNVIDDISPLSGLDKLTHVNLEHNTISDLEPLSELINLWEIRISKNNVRDLSPLSNLTNLRLLNISNNPITNLSPLSSLTRLQTITMSGNPLADLTPLATLTSLTRYASWGTPILSLAPLAELPKLQVIDICGGEISDLSSLTESTSLTELYFINNQISDLSPLKSLTGLKRLSLKENEVSDITSLSELTELVWLDLSHNSITDVSPLAKLTNLTWLHLSHNSISDISGLGELTKLAWLHISHNIISDLSPLAGLSSLTWLGFHNNGESDVLGLDKIPAHVFVSESGGIEGIQKGAKIVGPWLWVIVPGIKLGSVDLLANASGGKATEIKVSTYGAAEGKAVGDSKWTFHELSSTGHNNINEMTDALGWGSGTEIYDHVVYGAVTLESPREQSTIMFVGSDDGVKVWLNGELVHYNPVNREAGDYQDSFPVTLKEGTNVLLVAIDNHGHANFSGFFGFEANVEYTVNQPGDPVDIVIPDWDVNKDGLVDILDLILVGQNFGKASPSDPRADVNGDGDINISDLVLVAQHFGESVASGVYYYTLTAGEYFATRKMLILK